MNTRESNPIQIYIGGSLSHLADCAQGSNANQAPVGCGVTPCERRRRQIVKLRSPCTDHDQRDRNSEKDEFH